MVFQTSKNRKWKLIHAKLTYSGEKYEHKLKKVDNTFCKIENKFIIISVS
jgi:hypothetical protein